MEEAKVVVKDHCKTAVTAGKGEGSESSMSRKGVTRLLSYLADLGNSLRTPH